MTSDAAVAVAGVAGLAGLGILMAPDPTTADRRALAFPPELKDGQVVALLGAIAGLPARSRVRLVATGHDGQVSFTIASGAGDIAVVRSTAQGVIPGLRFLADEGPPRKPAAVRAHVGWRGSHVLLREDEPTLASASLLGVLRAAGARERIDITVRLRPVVRPRAPRQRPRGRDRDVLSRVLSPVVPLPSDELRLVRASYGGPMLNAAVEVRIWASSTLRARSLLRLIVAVLRARSGRRGRLSVRSHRFSLPSTGTSLTPRQIMPLLAWPLDSPDIPGVELARSPVLLPDRRIPRGGAGRCFGNATWPGLEDRQLRQPIEGALSHALVLGPTGSGKSALLTNLILDDVAGKRGALLLDMKGDTATDVLERIPEDRHGDVVILDPSDPRPLPGLKSMDASSPDLAADLWVGIFKNLFSDSWGVRTERYLRLGVQTLAQDRHAVITELPRVFSDPALRRRLLAGNNDPLLMSSWAAFDSLSATQQAEHLAAPLGKVQDILGRRLLRAVLGQARPKMTIARAMRERRIVVVRLAPALIGPPTSQVIGALVIYELFQAVMARQAVPTRARIPFAVYVDEPAVLQTLPVPLDSLYELARGLHVSLTIATQSAEQLPVRVRKAVLTNAATIATFRTNEEDSATMARKLRPATADQLEHLGQYEIAVRLGLAHGDVSSVATARTPAPRPAINNLRQLRDRAAANYGVAPEDVEQELRNRWDHPSKPAAASAKAHPDGAIGRRRRRS